MIAFPSLKKCPKTLYIYQIITAIELFFVYFRGDSRPLSVGDGKVKE